MSHVNSSERASEWQKLLAMRNEPALFLNQPTRMVLRDIGVLACACRFPGVGVLVVASDEGRTAARAGDVALHEAARDPLFLNHLRQVLLVQKQNQKTFSTRDNVPCCCCEDPSNTPGQTITKHAQW